MKKEKGFLLGFNLQREEQDNCWKGVILKSEYSLKGFFLPLPLPLSILFRFILLIFLTLLLFILKEKNFLLVWERFSLFIQRNQVKCLLQTLFSH